MKLNNIPLVVCLSLPLLSVFSVVAVDKSKEEIASAASQQVNEDSLQDKVIGLVHQSIRDNKMTALLDNCLLYDFNDISDASFYLVDVRENNAFAICGGDPQTSVSLFKFKVDRKNYSLFSDVGSVDGSFHKLKK